MLSQLNNNIAIVKAHMNVNNDVIQNRVDNIDEWLHSLDMESLNNNECIAYNELSDVLYKWYAQN